MLPICGIPLVERAYKILKMSRCDKVMVATDIEDLLKNPDIYTIHRPERLNGDDISVREVVKWIAKPFSLLGYEIVVVLFATNPRITYEEIDFAIEMIEKKKCEIVRSYCYGEENGLYVMTINKAIGGYDAYTGMIYSSGREIHTEKDYEIVKRSWQDE